jgi:hypothetical protein
VKLYRDNSSQRHDQTLIIPPSNTYDSGVSGDQNESESRSRTIHGGGYFTIGDTAGRVDKGGHPGSKVGISLLTVHQLKEHIQV